MHLLRNHRRRGVLCTMYNTDYTYRQGKVTGPTSLEQELRAVLYISNDKRIFREFVHSRIYYEIRVLFLTHKSHGRKFQLSTELNQLQCLRLLLRTV